MTEAAITWVDASGLPCPLPIVHLARAVAPLAPGTKVGLVATDAGITSDLPAWCEATGHALLSLDEDEAGVFRGVIERR
jgi:tRNA 2-thiouridine synthesizing protein A